MRRIRYVVLAAVPVMIAAIMSCSSSTTAPAVTYSLVAPGGTPHGHSWGEWQGMWWNWALSMPANHNPLNNTAPADTNQSGDVWFLGGNTKSDTSTRTIMVASGKALFFPILNQDADTTGGYPPLDSLAIIARSLWTGSAATRMEAVDIDGNTVTNVSQYFVDTLGFVAHLCANNIFGEPACTTASNSCGDYLMVDGLTTGLHTIHFHAMTSAKFVLDITYKVTVM